MNHRPLRFAMVGAGNHASRAIYPSLRYTDLELVAATDLIEERARSVASRFGSPRIYTDFTTMLKSEDLDAVGVVGPPELHHEAGLAVLDQGLHLFIEKPPAPSLVQARELQSAAAGRGINVMVGFMKRHASAYRRAKEITERAEFGHPTVLRLNYSHVHFPTVREHVIMMTVHALDLARFFMGNVTAGSVIKRDLGGNYVIVLQAQHEGGGISQITMSAHEPRVQESLEIAGESTLIQVRNLTELRYHPPAAGWDDVASADERMASVWYPEFTIPMEATDNLVVQGYAGELRHFSQSLRTGAPVSANIDDGVEAMRLAEALFDAADGVTTLEIAG